MDVHGMQFAGGVHNFPVLEGSDLCAHHRSGVRSEFFSVNVKAVFVFGESDGESWRSFFFRGKVQLFHIRAQ